VRRRYFALIMLRQHIDAETLAQFETLRSRRLPPPWLVVASRATSDEPMTHCDDERVQRRSRLDAATTSPCGARWAVDAA
jgi:hypothetical protein